MALIHLVVSGESLALAKAEIEELLKIKGIATEFHWYDKDVLFHAEKEVQEFLLKRAALVKEVGIIVGELQENNDRAFVFDIELAHSITRHARFRIDVREVSKRIELNEKMLLIRNLAELMKAETGASVSLDNPDIVVNLLVFQDKMLISLTKHSILRLKLRERNPGSKPFFHPSMMNSQLARVMCNLAGVANRSLVMDPFCGGGGILCEAALIGASVVGVELNWHLIEGARKNLRDINADYTLIQGNARSIPITECTTIVTDPPYGRTSSTRGFETIELIETVLGNISDTMEINGKVCMCGSTDMMIGDLIQTVGLKLERELLLRVHSGLTRQIVIAKFS